MAGRAPRAAPEGQRPH